MSDKLKVSIIVPVYNAEKYLNRCVESLINQTLKDIEMIFVNDGSTDNSINILKSYKEKDKRIVIIDKKNEGVSEARNQGISKAKGEFIFFVDSDDWIDLDTLEKMYKTAIQDDIDIVICSYVREFKDHSKEKSIDLNDKIIYKDNDLEQLHLSIIGPLDNQISKSENLDSVGTVWAKLYKSSLIQKSEVKFIDLKEIGSAEDTLFNIMLFKDVKTVKFINKPYYHYWKDNDNSVTSGYNPRLKEQRKVMFNYIKTFIDSNKLDEKFDEALKNRICISVLGLGLNECNKDNKLSLNKKIKNIKSILNDEMIKQGYKNFNVSQFPIHWRIFYTFCKYRQAVLTFLMLNSIEFLRKRV